MSYLKLAVRIATAVLFAHVVAVAATTNRTDICIYGGTSGGVSAAVAAARLGKSVSLISLNNHVGGMTASGLGVTDIGPGGASGAGYITGISKEFYRRVGQAYGSTNPVYYFEPKVAEGVFWQMLAESGIKVYTNKLLASVVLTTNRLTQLQTEDGAVFIADQFIDTTYEGDLIAAAGVTFTVGREGTNQYGERLAGIRATGGSYNYDPYVVPGNPGSGLLPFVQPGPPGTVGSPDHRLQAYNFRLCLTQVETNKIPITPPAGYSESQYELFRRYLDARVAANGSVSLSQLIHIQTIIPNGKTDINANGELSTDMVGYNYTWATNTYAQREVIRQAHEDYIRGLLYFYATSTSIPANVRAEAQSWGLAKDEFTDSGGWPWQIYVREARRMVSDYVMTEQNGEYTRVAPDPIALARYDFDSHGVQRFPSGGYSRWEGGLGGTPPFPYGISYRSIVPRSNECVNVYCTFALSASHVAFASCRMEPVFMMSSQAAATAAAFAIDDAVPSQQVNYEKLSAQLRADGMILDWPEAFGMTNGIIVDDSDTTGVVKVGAWTTGANVGGFKTNYVHDGASGKGTKSVTFTPNLPTNGTYQVQAWWVAAGSSFRSAAVPIDIVHPAGTTRVYVNQQMAGSQWNSLLTTNFISGTSAQVVVRNVGTTNFVVADAVRFMPAGSTVLPQPQPSIGVVASDAVAGEFGGDAARFSIVRTAGDTNVALTVGYTLAGTAGNGVDYTALSGSVILPAGSNATSVVVLPLVDNLVEGSESITLKLGSSSSYQLTSLSNANVTIQDRPLDAWRKSAFTASEINDPSISGDDADPDLDGLRNLLEYSLGLLPKSPDINPFDPRVLSGIFYVTYTRSKAATDVLLTVEQTLNLSEWSNDPAYVEEIEVLDEGPIERVTARLVDPVAIHSQSYLRFRAAKL